MRDISNRSLQRRKLPKTCNSNNSSIHTQPHRHHDPDAEHSLVDLPAPVQRLQLVPRRSSGSRRPLRIVFVPSEQACCRRGSASRHSGGRYGIHRPRCVLGARKASLRARWS